MSLHIKITNGDVVTWEYRGKSSGPAPAYREPIHLDPAYDTMLRRVAIAMGQTSWDLFKKYGG